MNDSYTTTFTVPSTAAEVTDAITDPRAWWMTDIAGDTRQVGDEFSFEVPGVHYSRLRVTDLIPGELVVWEVVDGKVQFVADQDEWTGTRIRFAISSTDSGTTVRFTHEGLRPTDECYDACSGAWNLYAGASLRDLLVTGTGQPSSNPDEVTFQESARSSR
ncbi:SRPBCC domain-containing protein [Amycolatopsis sp. NBC_00348]|uniref:SRPBCC family protein n=1 Tax=Amycolatopsis sp. NBC_00348 TaxID=2975956 RepID=UPI002E257391